MKARFLLVSASVVAASFALSACDGPGRDDGAGFVFKGTAATGAPVSRGSVEVQCLHGTGFSVSADEHGRFALPAAEFPDTAGDFPCMLHVGVDGDTDLYSLAERPGQVVNVTPFTTLVLQEVAKSRAAGIDSAALFEIWRDADGGVSLEDAKAHLKAHLEAANAGDAGSIPDFFTTPFLATAPGAPGKSLYDLWLDRFGESLAAAGMAFNDFAERYTGDAGDFDGITFTANREEVAQDEQGDLVPSADDPDGGTASDVIPQGQFAEGVQQCNDSSFPNAAYCFQDFINDNSGMVLGQVSDRNNRGLPSKPMDQNEYCTATVAAVRRRDSTLGDAEVRNCTFHAAESGGEFDYTEAQGRLVHHVDFWF